MFDESKNISADILARKIYLLIAMTREIVSKSNIKQYFKYIGPLKIILENLGTNENEMNEIS